MRPEPGYSSTDDRVAGIAHWFRPSTACDHDGLEHYVEVGYIHPYVAPNTRSAFLVSVSTKGPAGVRHSGPNRARLTTLVQDPASEFAVSSRTQFSIHADPGVVGEATVRSAIVYAAGRLQQVGRITVDTSSVPDPTAASTQE